MYTITTIITTSTTIYNSFTIFITPTIFVFKLIIVLCKQCPINSKAIDLMMFPVLYSAPLRSDLGHPHIGISLLNQEHLGLWVDDDMPIYATKLMFPYKTCPM